MSNGEALDKFPHGAATIIATGRQSTKRAGDQKLETTVDLPAEALLTIDTWAEAGRTGNEARTGFTLTISIDDEVCAKDGNQVRAGRPRHHASASCTRFLVRGEHKLKVERVHEGNLDVAPYFLGLEYHAVLARLGANVSPVIETIDNLEPESIP